MQSTPLPPHTLLYCCWYCSITKSNVTCTPSSKSDSGVAAYPADPAMQSAWKRWKILWEPTNPCNKNSAVWHLNELILNYTYWCTKYCIFENQCFKLERAKIKDEHVRVCSCWVYGRNDRWLEAKYHTADSKPKLALPIQSVSQVLDRAFESQAAYHNMLLLSWYKHLVFVFNSC